MATPNGNTPKVSKKSKTADLKQVRNCTHMAVTHLAEKLKPVTPQLHLLHDMCFDFMKNRQKDIFELLNDDRNEHQKDPIVDMGVVYSGLKNEDIPSHYELLSKSVSGKEGDLARHGARQTYIFYRRAKDEKPITALALISPDRGEEPPLGFEMIARTPGSKDADLTYRSRAPPLFLCIHRGDGPPITEIGVVHIKKEKIPPGWHQISRTPNGASPDLDMGQTVLSYKRDYKSVIRRFSKYQADSNPSNQLLARCLACLVGGIYSYDRQTFLYALEAFTSLDSIKKFPNGILADFVNLVRDALTAYITFFNREVYVKVLKWLGHVYNTRCKLIDTRAFMSMLHLCMFLRHEDSREEVGKSILHLVIKQSRAQRKQRNKVLEAPDMSDAGQMRALVVDLAEHVYLIKSTSSEVTNYLGVKVIDDDFHDTISAFVNGLYEHHFDRFMAAALILLAKVSAQSLPTKLTAKSEVIKRRIHALKLLAFFLEESRSFFKNDNTSLVLLRRFVFTSFIHSAITAVPAVFKTMFRLHEILWVQYRQYLKFEIGVLLDTGMVGLLQSQFCTPPQKVDLLDGLMQMFRNKAALINIFYNYDNDVINWPVCQHLVTVVANLTKGEYFTSNHYKAPEHRVVQGALRLLARFMELMARYLRAQNLNKGGNLDDQENFDELGTGFDSMGHIKDEMTDDYDQNWTNIEEKQSHHGRISNGTELTNKKDNDVASIDSGDNNLTNLDNDNASDYSNPKQMGRERSLKNTSIAKPPTINEENIDSGNEMDDDNNNKISKYNNNNHLNNPNSPNNIDISGIQNGINSKTMSPSLDSDNGASSTVSGNILYANNNGTSPKTSSNDGSTGPSSAKNNSANKPNIKLTNNNNNNNTNPDDPEAQPAISLSDNKNRKHVWEEHKSANDVDWNAINPRSQRANTWYLRYATHKEDQKVIDEALKIARKSKIKHAVKFLLQQGGRFADLKFIAQFLYANETLDKEEVGEFISALDTSTLTQKQHHDLLLIYVGLLDFTGMNYDSGFRHFLTDCGFRLPKEAQKIDRLIEAFAHSFARDNPSIFKDVDQVLVLSYGVLMLNTELHNPKAKAAAGSKGPMTKEQFVKLVQNGDQALPEDLLMQLYENIKENAIEMNLSPVYSENDVQEVQKQFRQQCSRLVQRANGKLREMSIRKHTWQKAKQREIVRALFDVTWHQFLAATQTVMQQTQDPQTQSVCLEAIKYSCATAICLKKIQPELKTFASDLAKFVYFQENKHLLPNVNHMACVSGQHLKQRWFENLIQFSNNSPSVGCEIVSHICNDMQARVIYDHDQKILRDIEVELGNALYLLHPARRFIHAGPLTKQSRKGDLDLYRFYLFNDLLIYVSGNPPNLTVHRVLHLSLCRILDLRDGFVRNIKNAFRIVSPQKPILLIASTAQEKQEWLSLITSAIEEQVEMRSRWINEQFTMLEKFHETARISKYMGRILGPKTHELARVQNGKSIIKSKDLNPDVRYEIDAFDRQPPCKLCIKPFKRFAKKKKCPWCLDTVDALCMKRKATLPTTNKPTKVCDGCFGAINYFMAEMNHTDPEFSMTETILTQSDNKSSQHSQQNIIHSGGPLQSQHSIGSEKSAKSFGNNLHTPKGGGSQRGGKKKDYKD